MERRPITPEKALIRLEALCARSERCTGELLRKLRGWGITRADAEEIVESLRQRRYVDDRRFAAAYVRDKVLFARWGRLKIASAMAALSLPRTIVDEALDGIDEEAYTEALHQLVAARIKAAPDITATREGRAKLYRSMLSRGFEPDRVIKAIKNS